MIFLFSGAVLLTSITGQQKLLLDGNVFGINRVDFDKTFWLCVSYYKTKCKCRCSLRKGILTRPLVGHNHNPPPADFVHRMYLTAKVKTDIREYSVAVQWRSIK